MKMLNKILTVIAVLLISGNAYSQTGVAFIQSEFLGSPNTPSCDVCTAGQAEYRMVVPRTGSLGPATSSAPRGTFNFDVQLRAATGGSFRLHSESVSIAYNVVAFGENAFVGGACTVTLAPETLGATRMAFGSPVTYGATFANPSVEVGAVAISPSASIPVEDAYLQITDTYQTLFSVSCVIADANATAGVAFHANTYDQIFRLNPTSGQTERLKPIAVATNSFQTNLLFDAPMIEQVRLWQNNRGVDLVFDMPIQGQGMEGAFRPSDFWVAQHTTSTRLTVSTASHIGTNNMSLRLEFAGSADTITNAMLIVDANSIAEVADTSVTYPSSRALVSLGDSRNDLRINGIALRRTGSDYRLELAVNNFDNYSGANNLGRANFTVPGLTVTGVTTDTSNIILAVTGVTRNTSSIPVMFSNRGACVGLACIRPVLPDSISTIGPPMGTVATNSNFPDFFGPEVTYTITNRGSVVASGGVLNYRGIVYRVEFDEDVMNPLAELVQRPRVGSVGSVTGGAMVACEPTPPTNNLRVYTCTQSGDAEFDPTAGNAAVAEFLLRLTTAQDSAGNNAVPLTAPVGVATIRTISEPIADSNDFWVIVDYGSPVTITNADQLAQASVTVKVSDTITGISITTPPTRGLPTGVTPMGVMGANVIHFRVTPTGTLDGGESARRLERFDFFLPRNTVSAGGTGNSADGLEFSVPDSYDANPEITALWLHSQGSPVVASSTTALIGGTTRTITYTLSDIVYRMRLTEPMDVSPSSVTLWTSMFTPEQSDPILALGSPPTTVNSYWVANAEDINLVSSTGTGSLYEIIFRNVELIRVGDTGLQLSPLYTPFLLSLLSEDPNNLRFPRSLVAIINPDTFSATGIEDCQGPTWYAGSRTATRAEACVSQNAAEVPDVYGPEATYTLTSRGSVRQGSVAGTLEYSGITYRVTFTEDVTNPMAVLVQRTRGDVVTAVTGTSFIATTATSGLREYTFTQSSRTAVFNPSAPDPVAEYYIRLTAANDAAGNSVENRDAPADQRIATIRAIPVAIDNSNDFWVVVDYGSPVMADAARLASSTASSISVMQNGGSITGVDFATRPALGLPAGVTIDGVMGANVIHFRLTPRGTLDGGESARGNEVFAFTLAAGTLTAGGTANTGDALEFNAIANGRPEITSLWLYSQDKSMTTAPSTRTVMGADGMQVVDTIFTLGDIVYRMRITEPATVSTRSVSLHSITQTPAQAANSLAAGVNYSENSHVLVAANATSIRLVPNESSLYEVRFSDAKLTRDGTSFPNGLVAVINPSAFSAEGIEDCQGTMWYAGSRTGTRMTHCVSQNAAETPTGVIPDMQAGQSDNLISSTRFVARSALNLSSFSDRMHHFGWIVGMPNTTTATATAATPYLDNTVSFSEACRFDVSSVRADLGILPPDTSHNLCWQVQDSRGFYVEGRSYKQTIYILQSISFARSVTAIPEGSTAPVSVGLESDSSYSISEVDIVGGEPSTRVSTFFRGPSDSVLLLGGAGTYDIVSNEYVWNFGDPLSKLAASTTTAAVGDVPQTRVIAVNGDQPPRFVEYDQPVVLMGIPHAVEVVVSGLPDNVHGNCFGVACNGFMAEVMSTSTVVSRIDMERGTTMTIVINSPRTSDAVRSDKVSIRLTGGTTSAPVTLVLEVTAVSDMNLFAAITGPDRDGDGIPLANDLAPSMNGLPIYYGGTLAGYIRATAGSRVQVSPVAIPVAIGRASAMMGTLDYEAFGANNFGGGTSAFLADLPAGTQAVFTFAIDRIGFEGNGIINGRFGAARAGVIIPLPSSDTWTPRKPVNGDFRALSDYGVFDSQGGSCPDDIGVNGESSPYRDDGGNLRRNAAGNCMVLYITDGSNFDADGQENGVIRDPVAMTTGASGGGGGGGGGGSAISLTQFAGITILLLLATAYGMYRRRKQPQPVRIIAKK